MVVPPLPRVPASARMARLLPVIALGGMAGIAVLMWGSGAVARGPGAVLVPVMMLVSAAGMAIQVGARGGTGRLDDQRRRYLSELERLGGLLGTAARHQRESLTWTHPAPTALWTLTGGPRMWERGADDSDFGHVRVGVGRQRLARRIVLPPVGPPEDRDPVTADALRRLVQGHVTADELPVAIALRGVGALVVDAEPARARALVRAMLCQLAVLHGPDVISIAAVTGRREDWDWLKWLPHNAHPAGDGAMVYATPAEAGPAAAELMATRHVVVVVVDGADHRSLIGSGICVIVVGEAPGEALRLHVDGDRLAVRTADGIEEFARADSMDLAAARFCARRLARHRGKGSAASDVARWCAAVGIGHTNDDQLEDIWTNSAPGERLRVAVGTTRDGALIDLDIKESADGGHGPHGLCVGATGSGKSELLRTIVLGLVARHRPDDLNFVLIDFKGGATFLGLEGLHHVAAVITNLSDAAHLVARAIDALSGEIHRRQQMLRRGGNAVNLAAYRRHRAADATLPALPTLFVVVDEFAELLHQHPEFADLFTMIGRVGRSLGVHLLLASQRLDEGRLRGLEPHLSYRICLKTSTAAESRAVLGVADAADLPAKPGAALLRTGDGRLIRFQAVYLGAVHPHGRSIPASRPAVRMFTSVPVPPQPVGAGAPTTMDAVVDRFRGRGLRAHQVWFPPLATSPRLVELESVSAGEFSAAIGVVDLPFEQRRSALVVDLAGAGGNAAVVGAPQSGKSTTLRTLVTALAARHEARRAAFYCLDFGGGILAAVGAYPHVGTVAYRHQPELVRRTVHHVGGILSARESHSDTGSYGDVFLVVDGWATLRDDFPDLEPAITAFAARGLSFGVHVILTAGRWADIRPGLKDQIGTRIELRLGDPLDSDIDRKRAALVPTGTPGRGITAKGDHFLIARPDGTDVAGGGSWCAPPVRLLPLVADHHTVVDEAQDPSRVLLGLGEDELTAVAVDFSRQAHLLIVGDQECGKTAALRTLCHELVRGATARPAQLFIVDYRRGLIGAASGPQLRGYAFSEPGLADQLPELIGLLQSRIPAADTPIEQLRARSWWTGPDVFVVVDDYDLVCATSADALTPLLSLLPHATDVGLHLVVARRCAGSARAMFEPVLGHLRDSGCMGLLMSGSPDEGPLIGNHRAAAQPPGRGLFVTRAGAQRVQVGWCAP